MIDGPYKSNRWLARALSIEDLLLLTTVLFGVVNFLVVVVELAVTHEFTKLTVIAFTLIVMVALAFIRPLSIIALSLLAVFIGSVDLWK